MAATSSGSVDWTSVIKPLLATSYGSLSKNDVPELTKTVIRCKREILKHDDQYDSFYCSFAALTAYHLSEKARCMNKNQLLSVSQACRVLLELFLAKLAAPTEQCCLTQKDLMLLVKGLVKGVGFLHRSDEVNLIATLKASKVPPSHSTSSSSTNEKSGTVDGSETKRQRHDPCGVILEHLMTPLRELDDKRLHDDAHSSVVIDSDIDNVALLSATQTADVKLFINRNILSLQQLNAGDVLINMCLELPYLHRYVTKYEDAVAGKGFGLPITFSDATSIRNGLQLLLNDVSIVWRAIMLPILEPLNEDRLSKLTTIVMSCLTAAITVAMASSMFSMSSSSTSKSSVAKDDDLDGCAVVIVVRSLTVFSEFSRVIRFSSRAGGHNLQNYQMIGAWTLLSGLQHILFLPQQPHSGVEKGTPKSAQFKTQESLSKQNKETTGVTPGRQSLLKVQQGFGVLSVALANHTIQLLVSLLDDLQAEVALFSANEDLDPVSVPSEVTLDIKGQNTAWQRVHKLLSQFNLTNLLYNLAAFSYRKACMLKRVQENLPEGETFSTSDSSSCCQDDISWSEDSSNEDDDDSEPILGHWFEVTLNVKSSPSNNAVTPPLPPTSDSMQSDAKLMSSGSLNPGALVPEKGEPHGFIGLASSVFIFMNQKLLSSECSLVSRYACSSLSEQHVVILAGIIKDLDRETSKTSSGDSSLGNTVGKLYDEFSTAISKYSHNVLATATLSDSLQNLLLSQLGVCAKLQEYWPLQVYPRTLAIVTHVFLMRQQTEKHELKSESEAACVLIWQRFLQTLQKEILNQQGTDSSADDQEDLNVEHAQLLLFLFHSLQLMQKKALLLECAMTIVSVSSIVQNAMKERQLLLLSRLLLVFEYLMKNLYEAPASLIEQVQTNLFNIHANPPSSNSSLDSEKEASSVSGKLYIPCKDVEDNYNRLCGNEDSHNQMKPRFYNLVALDPTSQDIPKLDGFSSNFILGTPDVLSYAKFHSSIVSLLGVAWQCDHPLRPADRKLSYLGHCAIQYCFSITWRLLLSLPPSSSFLESLLNSLSLEPKSHSLPLALVWVPRTSHKSFSTWLKDCLVRQGLTTQKADSLLRSLSKNKSVTYDVELGKAIISAMLAEHSKTDVGTIISREKVPQLYQIFLLDLVIAKLQVTVNEAFSKPALDNDPQAKEISLDLLPGILKLIELYSTFIRSSLLYQMNDGADPPGSYANRSLVAHGLTISLSSSRCSKASSLALPLIGYMPAPLRTVLDRWNASSTSEFPAISAWRTAFANDPVPSESYICAIQVCHIAALSNQQNFNTNLSLKHTLHALVRFVGDLIIWCPEENISTSLVEVLFPLCMDSSAEYLADFVTLTLERIIGSTETDEYLERVYYQALTIGNVILTNHTDKESGLDERVYYDVLKFVEAMLEKAPGKKALERFYGKDKDFCEVLLSASNEHLSPSYGTKVLKLFNKLFQQAEKSPSDRSLEKLCSSISGLAKANTAVRHQWLEKIICGPAEVVLGEDQNSLQENRVLFQSLSRYMISESSMGEMVSNVLLSDLIPMGTKMLKALKSSDDLLGFPRLLGIMATLAGAGTGVGHTMLFKSAVFWLNLSKMFLAQMPAAEKVEDNVADGKHNTLMESICCIMSYLADVLGAMKQSSDRYMTILRSGMASPLFESDFSQLDQDSDVADELGQEDEDSAGEDSDEDSLSNKLCTYMVTQKEFMNQHWYHCHTCKMVDGVGVCTICAKVCHKDHDVTYAKYGSFFCDCGAKEDGACQALVKRAVSGTAAVIESNAIVTGGSSQLASESILPSSLRRRSSSPATAPDRLGDGKRGSMAGRNDELKQRQILAKQLEPYKDNILFNISVPGMVSSVLEIVQSLKPAIETSCQRNSPVGSNVRIQEALRDLHRLDKTFETTDFLMLPTLGSQEGAFENVRMNYSGDQGQTIRQLIGAHMIHRVAMCCLSSSQGKRQHLAVSHEKGKITILQLSALLKQADSSKRKLTLTRLASAPVPFTVLSIAGNPCNEEFLAVCGLKDCHVLTFTPTGSIADHLALQPQPAIGNFIIKAVWLPGSQTELALVMPDFVKIYDLSVDALSPQYYFLLPSGKIRDCCFAFTEDGQRHLLLMSSAGHIYTQPMCEESSAKHGPFYVTNVLEVKHNDLKDSNGQVGGGGVSIYYSHALQLLFFSYSRGKSFVCPLPKIVSELTQLQLITFKTNGGVKLNTQPLCQWMEVTGHPGLICCLTQTNNNPVVLMVKPQTIFVQEIKILPAKAKITDMVAVRHNASNGEQRTTIILLCEDGSLRIYMADILQTGFWLMPLQQSLLQPSNFVTASGTLSRPSKKKKSANLGRPAGSVAFPVDFFENCQPMNDVEFGGNDVLQIYNTQQIKHRLNTAGMYIACTKLAGFDIEIVNSDSSMVMTGVRIMVGGQDIVKAPSYVEMFGRTIPLSPSRCRWYDFPFTRDESLTCDKKLVIFFGTSSFPTGVTTVDSIKVYGKSKDIFGWPEDTDEFATTSPTSTVPTACVPTGMNGDSNACSSQPLTSLDRLIAGSLEVLDNCFSVMPVQESKYSLSPLAMEMATHLLVLPTPSSVQQQTKNLLMSLHLNKLTYHTHKDQALLLAVTECLSADAKSQHQKPTIDVESFYNLVITARSIAVARPQNLVRFAESIEETFLAADDTFVSDQNEASSSSISPRLALLDAEERNTFLAQLLDTFWKLHDAQPSNPALAPVNQPGLPHLEVIVQALVEIIPAFVLCNLDVVSLASKLYLQLLLCENPAVSFVCKQAMAKTLRPRTRKRRVFIPSPPKCSSPGPSGTSEATGRDDVKPPRTFAQVTSSSSQEQPELEGVPEEGLSEAAAAIMSSSPLEALLSGQSGFPPLLDMPPDVDDETMVELAIALSLQDQSGQASQLGFQAFSLGASAGRTSSLERAQFSDTTASAGASDDEGSTAATDGSTLRTPPAEQGGSAGSESGGSGVDSITGEHNVSGRSSANGDNAPESTTTGARSETSSVGLPSTSLHPDVDGCEGEAETDGDTTSKLQNLRLLLLDRFLQYVPLLRDIGGVRSIPFLQVVLLLASDLDSEHEKSRVALDNLLAVMIKELEMDSKDQKSLVERTPRHEVQLIIMRLLSVLMSRPKSNGKSSFSDGSTFVSNLTAGALISSDAVTFSLNILKSLLEYWKTFRIDDGFLSSSSLIGNLSATGLGPPKGSLLRQRASFPFPNMAPFFLKQYVKGHANDVFEAYSQLLTEMVLRLPYQMKKIADSSLGSVPSPNFDQVWFFYLCEYMMMQQTPFVRKQVRKLLLFICGSKDRYRQLRDLYVLESNLKEVKALCSQGGYIFGNDEPTKSKSVNSVSLPYDSLITLIEHLKACEEIATSRTLNWQHFCEKDESVLPFLIHVSYLLDEGVSSIILRLLQCALCPVSASSSVTQVQQPLTTKSNSDSSDGQVSSKQRGKNSDTASTSEGSVASSTLLQHSDENDKQCAGVVYQVNRYVDWSVLCCFVKAFLLESNQSAIRWQAHSLIHSLFVHSTHSHQEALLDLMWRLWPKLPSYVCKAAQFVDLLGYFVIRVPPSEHKAQEYVDRACTLLRDQNRILAYHSNAALYTAIQGLVEFDGYYLESEPCLVCNDPEVPFTNTKLSSLKMDSCFTTTTQIVKLIGSHVISKIVLRIGDLKRSKMVRNIVIHYNNRSVQAVVELKNKPAMWHKAKRCTLAAGQTELKVEFPLPIVACNLMIEYTDFFENVQASSETLQCPRCSASVPANPGVCSNCGENVFQCHKCRAINYDEKDPFLCNTCGFCKYAKFDYTLTAKSCCAVDPIENEEDRKKAITFINTLLEKADRVYRQLVASKPALEVLLSKINEHNFEGTADDSPVVNGNAVGSGGGGGGGAPASVGGGASSSSSGTASVNKAIQQLAQRYCCDCKSSFEELGKIVQKVLATRKELVEYDRHQRESGPRTAGPSTPVSRESLLRSLSGPSVEEPQALSSGRCYGCASAATEHCITLLRALATNTHTRLVLCGQGLIRELIDYNLRQCSVQVCGEVRQLLCLLTRDNPKGTEELNSIIMEKISLALRNHLNTSDFASSVHHEMAVLTATVQRNDSCWEQRLRCVINLFLLGVNSRSPVVMENITLPCLCILQWLIGSTPPTSKKHKDKSLDSLATVHIEGNDVRIDLHKWLAGDARHSFQQWRNRVPTSTSAVSSEKKPKKAESRAHFLAEKYSSKWRHKARKDVIPVKLVNSAWLRRVLFDPSSHATRHEACKVVESLCSNPVRKKEILDLLTTFLDDLGKAGESATEFLTLYQNLIKPPQWKSYLAIRGVLPHIGNLITMEISHLTYLEETTLKSDLSEGYALRILTELLASFTEQDNIRRHYKSRLVGTVLNGYLSLRKLVIQRTKMVDETQEKLLELLEEMTTGNEAEIQAFMSVCVETVKKYPLDDFRTPVFIFERLCSIIYPEENDMGEFFMFLEKDPQQEDFLQGRMLGNPYCSNDPVMGPLMRDVKNKICQDCELVALLEDDNGMELLVCNKIISLDLPVKEVFKKVWQVENPEGESMRIVYRMRGLMGDATEEFIESLDARGSEEVDTEEVYKMASWMASCGGLQVMLDRLFSLNDLSRGRPLLLVLLKLFGYCTKVKANRQALFKPEMSCINTMLHVLRLALSNDGESLNTPPGNPSITEQLLQIMETILVEASSSSPSEYPAFAETSGEASDIAFLLDKLSSLVVRNSAPILQRLMRVLSFLATGNPEKLNLLVEFFQPCTDFVRFDLDHQASDDLKMECLCLLAGSIERNDLGNQLKDRMVDAGIVRNALQYIQTNAPPIRSALFLDSDELKEFISKPSLKYILRLLTGLSYGHERTQSLVSAHCIPIIHRLEQVSSDEHVGSLAENLMEALRENSEVAQKIEEVRKLTRAEKKRLAMAMREKQLAGLGMSTNERGQVTAKSSILQQMEELAEENGLVCVICREGYRFQPTKVLGIYTYTKRCNAEDFENKQRKTQGYSTVTHFNVVHVDCHMSAVRLARGRDEWESAALQNANTRCNGLLPLWGPQVTESAFASCLARHNTYLQECTGHRDIGYPSTIHDLKLLLLRFANEKSFSEDSGGGGPQSNLHLIPYILHMAVYVINTTRSVAKEDEALNVAYQLPSSAWFENSYEVEGPLYKTTMSLIVHSPSKWKQTRIGFLKQLIALAHCRHLYPKGSNRMSDKEVKEYGVYKPTLIFYALVNGIYSYVFKKVSCGSETDWPTTLADYIRNNDQPLLEGGDKLLAHYQDELLPCQSFAEFCDVTDLLSDIANPDDFFSDALRSIHS